jgi:hypothetical protein
MTRRIGANSIRQILICGWERKNNVSVEFSWDKDFDKTNVKKQ